MYGHSKWIKKTAFVLITFAMLTQKAWSDDNAQNQDDHMARKWINGNGYALLTEFSNDERSDIQAETSLELKQVKILNEFLNSEDGKKLIQRASALGPRIAKIDKALGYPPVQMQSFTIVLSSYIPKDHPTYMPGSNAGFITYANGPVFQVDVGDDKVLDAATLKAKLEAGIARDENRFAKQEEQLRQEAQQKMADQNAQDALAAALNQMDTQSAAPQAPQGGRVSNKRSFRKGAQPIGGGQQQASNQSGGAQQ